ncbi:hypothetical protein CTI14_30865, partial [Methylobacterium radiotolerans]
LPRLIPLLAGLLEHNISATRATTHKRWLAGQLHDLTPLIEQALPACQPAAASACSPIRRR